MAKKQETFAKCFEAKGGGVPVRIHLKLAIEKGLRQVGSKLMLMVPLLCRQVKRGWEPSAGTVMTTLSSRPGDLLADAGAHRKWKPFLASKAFEEQCRGVG